MTPSSRMPEEKSSSKAHLHHHTSIPRGKTSLRTPYTMRISSDNERTQAPLTHALLLSELATSMAPPPPRAMALAALLVPSLTRQYLHDICIQR
jgi:hypothetical protein